MEAQKQLNQPQAEYCNATSSISRHEFEKSKLIDRIAELEESATQLKASKKENKKILENNAARISAARAMVDQKIKEARAEADKRVKEAEDRVEIAIQQGCSAARADFQEKTKRFELNLQEEHEKKEKAEKKYKELEETQKKMRDLLGWK